MSVLEHNILNEPINKICHNTFFSFFFSFLLCACQGYLPVYNVQTCVKKWLVINMKWITWEKLVLNKRNYSKLCTHKSWIILYPSLILTQIKNLLTNMCIRFEEEKATRKYLRSFSLFTFDFFWCRLLKQGRKLFTW